MSSDPADGARVATGRVVVVLVAALDRRVLPALQFALRLPADRVKAWHVATDPDSARDLAVDWMGVGLSSIVLEIHDLRGGSVETTVRRLVEAEAAASNEITLVIPELHLPRWWMPLLHHGNARRIIRDIQSVPRVTPVLVPFAMAPAY